MFDTKPLNFGFVILSPEHNFGHFMTTARSIGIHYPGIPGVCVTAKSTPAAQVKEMKTLCPTFKGKDTITSLINTGVKKGVSEWKLIVMEGTYVRRGIINKYSRFIEDEGDVLYPIITDYSKDGYPVRIYTSFDEATLDGMFMHQKTFKEVGDFSDNPLNVSKLMWALEARRKGKNVRFKGILGARLC